jgi:ATP-dependent RNA helicase DDX24/MAK5
LKWKPVKTGPVAGFDDGGGMMMFEELEGVDVQWEEGLNGQKTAKFLVCPLAFFLDSELTVKPKETAEEEETVAPSKKQKKDKGKKKAVAPKVNEKVDEDEDEDEEEALLSEGEEEDLPTFADVDEEDLNDEDEDVEEEVEPEPEFDGIFFPSAGMIISDEQIPNSPSGRISSCIIR